MVAPCCDRENERGDPRAASPWGDRGDLNLQGGDLGIAYQVFGEGPDLVCLPGWVSHLDMFWEGLWGQPVPRRCRLTRG